MATSSPLSNGEHASAPNPQGRTLVLCFDGTWQRYSERNSNVVKLFSFLKKNETTQLCYYQPGVGTWFKPGVLSPLLYWFAVLLDLAIAWYLDHHVMEGYRFLMQNYKKGDRICLFGFSRGAYIARALAGMLHKVGLLPRDNDTQLSFAYKLYKRGDEVGLQLCEGFKQTYCQEVDVEFVGVWDTVSSVGVIMGESLPFTNMNCGIKTFRHALSLDERRARFRPNPYHRSSSPSTGPGSGGLKLDMGEIDRPLENGGPERSHHAAPPGTAVRKDDVLEVWFAGYHEDVGGGLTKNNVPNSLSNIPLRWMVRQIIESDCGIELDAGALGRAGISANGSLVKSRAEEEAKDALQPMHNAFRMVPLWWILELFPGTYVWQDANGAWRKTWGWHLSKGRRIHGERILLHETVKFRMEQSIYRPNAKWEGTEEYVH